MSNIYYFQAKDHNQRVVNGRVKASSREEVREKLISRQLVLIQANTKNSRKHHFLLEEFQKVLWLLLLDSFLF